VTRPLLAAGGVRRELRRGGDRFAVDIEKLELRAGDRVAIIGPSGSGKSTVLAELALALRPDRAASFEVAGTDVAALWRNTELDRLGALRARSIGFVPQTGGLLPFLSLRANIALPLDLAGRADDARVAKLAAGLDITAALDRRPADVSVGQRQRAAVARAAVHRPALLLADEPTAAVHPLQARATLDLLAAVAADAALLIATHDIALAEQAGLAIAPMRLAGKGDGSAFGWPC
jgi:putative ABC transport system ATP-binding protein